MGSRDRARALHVLTRRRVCYRVVASSALFRSSSHPTLSPTRYQRNFAPLKMPSSLSIGDIKTELANAFSATPGSDDAFVEQCAILHLVERA